MDKNSDRICYICKNKMNEHDMSCSFCFSMCAACEDSVFIDDIRHYRKDVLCESCYQEIVYGV